MHIMTGFCEKIGLIETKVPPCKFRQQVSICCHISHCRHCLP